MLRSVHCGNSFQSCAWIRFHSSQNRNSSLGRPCRQIWAEISRHRDCRVVKGCRGSILGGQTPTWGRKIFLERKFSKVGSFRNNCAVSDQKPTFVAHENLSPRTPGGHTFNEICRGTPSAPPTPHGQCIVRGTMPFYCPLAHCPLPARTVRARAMHCPVNPEKRGKLLVHSAASVSFLDLLADATKG